MNVLLAFAWPVSNSVIERLGWVLLHSLWQFALVSLLAAMAVRVLRRWSAELRYGLLVTALATTLALPVGTWLLMRGNSTNGAASRESMSQSREPTTELDPMTGDALAPAKWPILENGKTGDGPASDQAAARPALETSTVDAPAVFSRSSVAQIWSTRLQTVLRPYLAWIVAGWSLGALLCSLRPLLGWRTLRRLERVGVSQASDEVLAALSRPM